MAEDSVRMAGLRRRGLEEEGYCVDVAGRHRCGLARGGRTRKMPLCWTSCYLVDVMLPGSNGLEVSRDLRAAERWAPVWMLTASDEVSRHRHLQAVHS